MKALRARRRDVALPGNRWQRCDANDERAQLTDEVRRLIAREAP